jgi:hypothetical protein
VFTAHDAGCVTVSFTTGTVLFVAAYGPGGFVSSNPATNYLADAGSSFGGPSSFSFNVAAGQTFTVVVHEVNAGTGIGTNYTLAVLGSGIGACQTIAANGGAIISGRVTTSSGQGLRNATVTIINPAGSTRTTVTSSFGTYQFEGLEVGRDYMITVTSKRFRFATRTVSLTGNLADVNLIGLE